MDKEVNRRKPAEGPHRKVAGTTVVVQGEESVIGVKTFQVFPVSAFRLAAMSGCVRTDKFMLDAQLGGSLLKRGQDIPLAVGEAVSKFKAVVGLATFHTDTPAGIPLRQPSQKVRRGVSRPLRLGGQEAEPGKLVNSCILEQAKLRIRDTAAGDDLHIRLDFFSRTSHLLVRFRHISLFLLLLWEHPQFCA